MVHTPAPPPAPGSPGLSANGAVHIDAEDWWWVPLVVIALFGALFLVTRSTKRFKNRSARSKFRAYVSIEPFVDLEAVDSVTWEVPPEVRLRCRRKELGHQFFTLFGCVLLFFHWTSAENADNRGIVKAMTLLQLLSLTIGTVADTALAYFGYSVLVHHLNTRMRFSHCTFQVVLFLSDTIQQAGMTPLPVDCFVWASVHFAYESIARVLAGNTLTGWTQFSVVVLVNASMMRVSIAANGWGLALGLSSLFVSSLSTIIGMVMKLYLWRRMVARRRNESTSLEADAVMDSGALVSQWTNATQRDARSPAGATHSTRTVDTALESPEDLSPRDEQSSTDKTTSSAVVNIQGPHEDLELNTSC